MGIHSSDEKILDFEDFLRLRHELKQNNVKISHCHGVFDLLHPGHIAHLQEAKKIADILVVTITAADFVNKGPGRPYFNDELRLQSIAALECVDYVVLAHTITAIEMIDLVQPDYYVKGKEYANIANDITRNIINEVQCVKKYGGEVYYTDGVVFSSTKLLNNYFEIVPPVVKDYAKQLIGKYSFEEIRRLIDNMKDIKVAVVGDVIIDEYVFCKVQGLMSKDRAFSALYEHEERYLGGILAIARHLSSFSKNVTVCSIVGAETDIHSAILESLSSEMKVDLVFEHGFQTPVKRRYLERRGIRDEYEKLFSVNLLQEMTIKNLVERSDFYRKLEVLAEKNDLIVLADYGHGVMDEIAMNILQKKAKFLAVNCQTNSSNLGTNLITKYGRADAFVVDERELRLSFSANKSENIESLLKRLKQHFKSQYGWGTIGSLGSVGINDDEEINKCPALTLTVQDTVGAGDAFFALVSLCAKLEVPLSVSSFVGNLAGAMAANIVGNAQAISKTDLLKFATTLLKY